jgi:ketopantoate reductase
MGFWQKQQVNAAARYLRWHYEKKNADIPEPAELERQAENLVAHARQIARRTGRNVLVIVKDLVDEIKRK